MKKNRPIQAVAPASAGSDLLGASRLILEAVGGVTELVEAVHMNVLNRAIGTPVVRPVAGVTSLVYRSVKGVTALVGGGLDAALRKLAPALAQPPAWAGRDAVVAALNGVLGDRLAQTGNPLAIPMQLHWSGEPRRGMIVLLHGLCMNHLQWQRDGVDHGAMLSAELGYTPVYVQYNSGRHISDNGRAFADKLQGLAAAWPLPVDDIVIVGHSMGGLVARSACHYASLAGHAWLPRLSRLAFLGTPHHGAPLERGGNWIHLITDMSAYSAPFARLARLRSAGITDLRHGSVLDADWQGRDRFERGGLPQFLPLPPHVHSLAIGATVAQVRGSMADSIAGDGLVPLTSALGEHGDPGRCFPMNRQVVLATNHMQLLSSPDVARHLSTWLSPKVSVVK